jgi:hypothetical protein
MMLFTLFMALVATQVECLLPSTIYSHQWKGRDGRCIIKRRNGHTGVAMQADLQESDLDSEKESDKDMIDLFEREDRLMDVGNIQMEPCILVGVEDLSYHRLSGEEKVRSRQMETIGT